MFSQGYVLDRIQPPFYPQITMAKQALAFSLHGVWGGGIDTSGFLKFVNQITTHSIKATELEQQTKDRQIEGKI